MVLVCLRSRSLSVSKLSEEKQRPDGQGPKRTYVAHHCTSENDKSTIEKPRLRHPLGVPFRGSSILTWRMIKLLEVQLQCELDLSRIIWSEAGRSNFAKGGTVE